MKLFFTLLASAGLMVAVAQERSFTVKGSLPPSAKKLKVLLSWNNGATAEEATVLNGRFTIKGTIDEPVMGSLMLQEVQTAANKAFDRQEYLNNNLQLFLDSGTITVSSKTVLAEAVVKGSPVVNSYYNYTQQIKPITKLEQQLGMAYYEYAQSKNAKVTDKLMEVYKIYTSIYADEQLAFIKKNPASSVSLFFVQEALGFDMDAARAIPLFEQLAPSLQQSEQGKEVQLQIQQGMKTMVGMVPPDFTQPTPDGVPVTLSSFKGRYVLVDFWASWCGPCRAESPNMVKAYEKYKKRGFEILGVSLDEQKDRWLKAVSEDKYTWPQVGDLKGWENTAAAQYGIRAIPFNLLLDPNGAVIARNLRGEELAAKLKEIFRE